MAGEKKVERNLDDLRYVRLEEGRLSLGYFPDFLIIGPQRTGTTWLYRNLYGHPDIFLSERKEIYFFNLLNLQDHPEYRSNSLEWYLECFRERPVPYVKKLVRAWAKYHCLYRPKIRGEATASYAAMEPELISEITTINPRIKAIIMIRNPIERAWSHAKKDLVKRRKRSLEAVSEEEFNAFFLDSYQIACGRYTDSISNWEKFIEPGNLFIGLYQDIQHDPGAFLQRVLAFLGARSDGRFCRDVHKRINAGGTEIIPRQYKALLLEQFGDEIERLRSNYGIEL